MSTLSIILLFRCENIQKFIYSSDHDLAGSGTIETNGREGETKKIIKNKNIGWTINKILGRIQTKPKIGVSLFKGKQCFWLLLGKSITCITSAHLISPSCSRYFLWRRLRLLSFCICNVVRLHWWIPDTATTELLRKSYLCHVRYSEICFRVKIIENVENLIENKFLLI